MHNVLSLTGYEWILDDNECHDSLSIPSFLARKRGIDLQADMHAKLPPPDIFPEMGQAVSIIQQAMSTQKKIAIVGDYDADGITGTLQLARYFRRHGVEPIIYLPDRLSEGYGLSPHIITTLADQKVDLLITVDTGITAHDVILQALLRNIDVIVTDHHSPRLGRPPASAVIHPLVPTSCGFEHFCGAGVVFMLIRALEGNIPWEGIDEDLALATIGTIGDIVPLNGANRTLVRYGLSKIRHLKESPLQSLLHTVAARENITSHDIAFRVVPRINAAGRMAHPRLAFDALSHGGDALNTLHSLNEERQGVVAELLEHALTLIDDRMSHLIMLHLPQATAGTVGLIAGKLTEKTGKPTLISAPRDGVYTASLRSPEHIHITDCLSNPSVAPLLLSFGGHAQAAGCSYHPSSHEDIFSSLQSIIQESVGTKHCVPTHKAHLSLRSSSISLPFIHSLRPLMPYGAGNDEPLFLIPRVTFSRVSRVGKEEAHLSCLTDGIRSIGFSLGHLTDTLSSPQSFDILATLSVNEWNGLSSPQLVIRDIRRATTT